MTQHELIGKVIYSHIGKGYAIIISIERNKVVWFRYITGTEIGREFNNDINTVLNGPNYKIIENIDINILRLLYD